jgi:hypothetical protein
VPATGKVKGTLKIYDVVGNTVNWGNTDDLFHGVPDNNQTAPSFDFYWNGLNANGMKCSPGVYRVVIYIDYPGASNISDVKLIKKVGLGSGTTR